MTKDWEPDVNKEYLIEYKFPSDKKTIFIIGTFGKTWFGYNFSWYWAANGLQLSKNPPTNDYKSFKRVWEFSRMMEDYVGNIEL